MVLARMHLLNDSADPRAVLSKKDKEILDHETLIGIILNDLHVSQALLIGADFIGTFYNEDAVTS